MKKEVKKAKVDKILRIQHLNAELFSLFFDDLLTEKEKKECEIHLAHCPACRAQMTDNKICIALCELDMKDLKNGRMMTANIINGNFIAVNTKIEKIKI